MNNPALKAVPADNQQQALVEQYLSAKAHLATAKKILDEAEKALIENFGVKEEGTFSVTVADKYKVATTGKINRTISGPIWDEVKREIPEPLAERLVQYKPSLNLRELRYVELNEPEWFAKVAKAITSKPAKASVKVDVLEG